MPRSVFDLIKDKNTILGETSGWPLVPEFLDLLELLVDSFFTCKMLEKGSFGHNALEIFLIFFLVLLWVFYIHVFLHLCKVLQFQTLCMI